MEAFTREEEVWVDSLVYYGSLHTYVPVPFKIPPYTDSGFSYLAPFHKRRKKKLGELFMASSPGSLVLAPRTSLQIGKTIK